MAEAAVYRDPEFQPKEGVARNGESEEQPASPLRLTPLPHRDGQRMFFLRPLHLEPTCQRSYIHCMGAGLVLPLSPRSLTICYACYV